MNISDERKARILWQCRRGMLELDLILQNFVKKHIDELSLSQIDAFENLQSYSDPDLYSWLMGDEVPEEQELIDIVTLVKLKSNV